MKISLIIIMVGAILGGCVASKTSVSPAPLLVHQSADSIAPIPQTIKISFHYEDTNVLGWVNLLLERKTNIDAPWESLYTWYAPTDTYYVYTDTMIFPSQFYQAGAQWTNEDEQFRPSGY